MRPTLSLKLGQSNTRYAVPSSLTGPLDRLMPRAQAV